MKLYRTFKDSVNQYLDENLIHKRELRDVLQGYAKWLDGFQVATKDFEILALKKAREMDREMLSALIDEVNPQKVKEIITNISNRHRHYSQWQDQQNKRGVPNSLIARSWLKRKNKMLSHLTWHLGKLWPHARTLGLTKPTEALPEEINKQIDENRKAIENSK